MRLALFLLAAVPARARVLPPADPGLTPRSIEVIDDHGRRLDLTSLLRGPGTAILLPIYTRCGRSCPVLAESLKSALGKASAPRFRVIVFSFDASDRDADLLSFRKELSLPEDWTVVRAAREGEARGFLDQLGYRLMQDKHEFVHPNELFIFSAEGRWSGTLAGSGLTEEDLQAASRPAGRPWVWASAAAAGLALFAAAVAALSIWRA